MTSKWILFAAVAALYGCGGQTQQNAVQTATADVEVQQAKPQGQITGGYSDQRSLRTDEEQLFDGLTAAIDSVSLIAQSVSTQVVAGTNYKYLCEAAPKGGGASYQAEVVIFKPLPNHGVPKITRFERIGQ